MTSNLQITIFIPLQLNIHKYAFCSVLDEKTMSWTIQLCPLASQSKKKPEENPLFLSKICCMLFMIGDP